MASALSAAVVEWHFTGNLSNAVHWTAGVSVASEGDHLLSEIFDLYRAHLYTSNTLLDRMTLVRIHSAK